MISLCAEHPVEAVAPVRGDRQSSRVRAAQDPPAVEERAADVVAEATVDNADGVLRPGMFASVRLQNGEEKTPVVPKNAVVTRGDKQVAFVVENGRLEQRIVQTGDVIGEEIAVLRGIADGERLVLAPAETLKNGQAVK